MTILAGSRVDYEMIAGDDLEMAETCYEEDGETALNLTGATISTKVEFSTVTGGADVTKSIGSGITVTDATAGQFSTYLDSTDSEGLTIADGVYPEVYYQHEITDAAGNVVTFDGYITLTRDLA